MQQLAILRGDRPVLIICPNCKLSISVGVSRNFYPFRCSCGEWFHDPGEAQRKSAERPIFNVETREPRHGVGHWLASMLWAIHIREKDGCGCKDYAAELDRRGPAWCRKNESLILDELQRRAGEHDYPFSRTGAAVMLRMAIWMAERGPRKIVRGSDPGAEG